MSRILDEMIQEKVDSGHVVRGVRGSVRLASEQPKSQTPAQPAEVEALPENPIIHETKQLALEV